MPSWILVKRFCALSGYTVDAVYIKCNRGIWAENVIWRKGSDGHLFINVPAYDNWVAGNPPANATYGAQ